MIKLLIDTREHAVKKYFENQDQSQIVIDVVQLNVGDFQFWQDDKRLLLVVERKTYEDLAASIKDGRYYEQKYRLQELRNSTNCSIIYFIERSKKGNVINGIPKSTLESAVLSIISKENMNVIEVNNTQDTITALKCFCMIDYINIIEGNSFETFCSQICKKMIEKVEKGSKLDSSYNVVSENTKKKSYMTQENVFIQQLALIKSVSLKMAEAVHKNYKNFYELIAKYESLETEKQKERLLKEIVLDNNRKLGPVASKNIYFFCYGKEDKKKNDIVNTEQVGTCLI